MNKIEINKEVKDDTILYLMLSFLFFSSGNANEKMRQRRKSCSNESIELTCLKTLMILWV